MPDIYDGEVRGGVIVLAGGPLLPEGTRVRVEPIEPDVNDDTMAATRAWLLGLAAEVESIAPLLPSDLAEHHDHYAHGKPRP